MLRDLGVQLRERGKFAEARSCFVRALEADPLDGRAHRFLIEIQDPAEPGFAEHVGEIFRLLQNAGLAESDRIDLHFALGGALDRLSRYDEAFVHFREGNRLRRARIAYHEPLEAQRFELLQALFNRTIARAAVAGPRDARPIFVIGMPRSGTTLVESLLAQHPAVSALGELPAFERSFNALPPVQADPRDHTAFLAELRANVADIGNRYLADVGEAAAHAVRVVDKMPPNFRFAVPIHLALPSAKLVHVRRGMFDTCFSCYATNFFDGQEYAFDCGELARYYALYERHMEYVRGLLPPNVMLELDYEEIVADLEGAARSLLAHCGLEWDACVLTFWRDERPVTSASVVQVRRPIYSSSIGRARNYPAFCEEFAAAIAATA